MFFQIFKKKLLAEMANNKKNVVFLHPDLGLGGAERLIVDASMALQTKVLASDHIRETQQSYFPLYLCLYISCAGQKSHDVYIFLRSQPLFCGDKAAQGYRWRRLPPPKDIKQGPYSVCNSAQRVVVPVCEFYRDQVR